MSKKIDLGLYEGEGKVIHRDKNGDIIAVYIPNEVTTAPSIVEFQNYIINAVSAWPNDMDLGGKIRKYVNDYENFRQDTVDVSNINEYKTQ